MVDWESIRDKYENNCETFVSNLLKQTGSKEYAHSGDFFYQRKDCSKIKQIRGKYRKALDAGRRSGGIWSLQQWISGLPATKSIQAGLETVESLKTSLDKDIDPLERVSKENNERDLEEEEDFNNKASSVISSTCSISSISPI